MDETSSSFSASNAPQLRFGKIDDLKGRVTAAVDGARKFLFSQQHEQGYWCGELVADTTLESDYILLHTLLGTGKPRALPKVLQLDPPPPERRRRLGNLRQRPKHNFCAQRKATLL